MATDPISECVAVVRSELSAAANPAKATGMQAYMKSDMPFYGVQKPGRAPILRKVLADYRPTTRDEYADLVLTLWHLPHREEKYIALGVAAKVKEFIIPDSLPLYRRLIHEGALWDFVDEVATHIIRTLVLDYPSEAWSEVETWIDNDDMWLRRAAIICQVGAKDGTNADRLFAFCAQRAHEKEFFIRKAIGWALRDYAKSDPESVACFVSEHRSDLSGLSFREATKHISHLVAG